MVRKITKSEECSLYLHFMSDLKCFLKLQHCFTSLHYSMLWALFHLPVNWPCHGWRLDPFAAGKLRSVLSNYLARGVQGDANCLDLLCILDKVTAVRPKPPPSHCTQTSSLKHTQGCLSIPAPRWPSNLTGLLSHKLNSNTQHCFSFWLYWFSIKVVLFKTNPTFSFSERLQGNPSVIFQTSLWSD